MLPARRKDNVHAQWLALLCLFVDLQVWLSTSPSASPAQRRHGVRPWMCEQRVSSRSAGHSHSGDPGCCCNKPPSPKSRLVLLSCEFREPTQHSVQASTPLLPTHILFSFAAPSLASLFSIPFSSLSSFSPCPWKAFPNYFRGGRGTAWILLNKNINLWLQRNQHLNLKALPPYSVIVCGLY